MSNSPAPIHVRIPGGERTVMPTDADAGRPMSVVLRRHGVPLNTRCAGRGLCESCRVTLDGGEPVQACQIEYDPSTEYALTVPPRSMVADSPQVLEAFVIDVPLSEQPITDARYAIAIDIGTTTVAAVLVDLGQRHIARRASAFNHQLHLGDDVLTRINLCLTDPTHVGTLRDAVVDQTIRPLLDELAEAIEPDAAAGAVVIAGNTTMQHLVLGVDPSPMGIAPFPAAFLEHRELPAGELLGGSHPAIADDAAAHLLPSAAAYVGADIVGGCLVSGMAYGETTAMFVDVGTNGEIALRHDGHLTACATAAGPAFEGQGLTSGVRATDGAICNVAFNVDDAGIELETIRHGKPIGLCGSAYIDFLARGRALDLLQPNGRFSDRCCEVYADRIEVGDYGRTLRLAKATGGEPIVVAEADVASLLQAKAAIGAGISTLLARVGMKPDEIEVLHLAGGFGMHLHAENAIGCGLLPGFSPEQVHRVGNTSLGSAFAACLDRSVIDEASRFADRFEVLELNLEPGFEDTFIDHLGL